MNTNYIIGEYKSGDFKVPQISSVIGIKDFLGAVRVRWGMARENYRVAPGLYAAGAPDRNSDVFVTANYKLSFDNVRKNLSGIDCWILVLDTKGVNVWCAASKGTFSTSELFRRIKASSLDSIVDHKRLILPQLGATGVAAHKVKDETGFNVHYGPIRASDIKKFIADKYRADKDMRKVRFRFTDRIKLIPNDFIYSKYYLLGSVAVLILISGLSKQGISFREFSVSGGPAILKVFFAYCGGIVLTPLLLPYLPGRHFSLKGFISGTIVFLLSLLFLVSGDNLVETISWFFIITAISSFLAMNFTGSSTYTSLSGVRKEMKIFVPVQIGFAATGLILQIIGKYI